MAELFCQLDEVAFETQYRLRKEKVVHNHKGGSTRRRWTRRRTPIDDGSQVQSPQVPTNEDRAPMYHIPECFKSPWQVPALKIGNTRRPDDIGHGLGMLSFPLSLSSILLDIWLQPTHYLFFSNFFFFCVLCVCYVL